MTESVQDDIQSLLKIKQTLAMAAAAPVSCAFGMTKDRKECLLLVDKRTKGKTLVASLKTDGKAMLDPASLRFGKVSIDEAADPDTLRFTMNKSEPAGSTPTLLRLVKKAGYKAIVFTVDDGLENEGEDVASGADPNLPKAASPELDAGALKGRITELVKQLLPRLAAEPARKQELTDLAKSAQAALAANDLAAATEVADRLQAVLATQPVAVPATPAAAPSPAAAPAAQAGGGNRAEQHLRELVKLIPGSIAANPALKGELLKLAGEANAKLKAGPPEAATAAIEALGRIVQNASVSAEEITERLGDIRQQASALPDPARGELLARIAKVSAGAGSANPALTAGEVGELEDALAHALTASRTAGAAAESGDTVSVRGLQSTWREAQAQARSGLDAFIKKVLADPEIQQHPGISEIESGLADASGDLPDFGSKLEDSLAQMDDARDAAARRAAREAAVTLIGEYRATLDEADSLRELQELSDTDYGGLSFYGELHEALQSLERQLAKI